jgi:Zn-dependent protease with chaperone function
LNGTRLLRFRQAAKIETKLTFARCHDTSKTGVFIIMLIKRYALILLVVSTMIAQMACRGGSQDGLGSKQGDTHFKPGFNLFSPEQDVQLGRQSAQEVARQMPLLRDDQTVNFIKRLGAKLAAKAPGYKFPYQFEVTAVKDVNAFALPGGFMFVNAGAIAAAKNEGELAGVMAHEIAHVALRHGTNQATKAYIAKAGLDVLTGIVGGNDTDLGQVIGTIGGVGANALFLKFGRTAETQADLEGARIMAEAGYDPRDLANFFKTLQTQSGQRVPEIVSDHPDPGNRVQTINKNLPSLPVSQNPVHDTDEFEQVKARLTGNRASFSASDPKRVGPDNPNKMGNRPEPPSANFKGYQTRDGSFSIEFPENWDGFLTDEMNLILAPKGGYAQTGKDNVMVTHGVFVGAMPVGQRDLQAANEAFVQQQVEANPDFRIARQPQRINFGDRQGYATIVAGQSPVTGVIEVDVIYTTATSDGRLFYFVTIVPEDEAEAYKPTFEHIINSIRLAR